MFTLYLLLCADGFIYTGITGNLAKRLEDHNRKRFSHYVASRLPYKLIYTKHFSSRKLAAQRERQIKGWKRLKKISVLNLKV